MVCLAFQSHFRILAHGGFADFGRAAEVLGSIGPLGTKLELSLLIAQYTYSKNRYSRCRISFLANNPEHRDLFPGALEVMILQSLRLKPMHGYALVKHIKQVSEDLLQVEEGSLYPALQRMLREGWLEAETGISAKGRPTRIYRLTDAGIRHLEKEVVSFEKMFAGITRVLTFAKV